MQDFEVSNHGSVWSFTPRTAAAQEWVEENVHLEAWQQLGASFAVDHRFAFDLLAGIAANGLTFS